MAVTATRIPAPGRQHGLQGRSALGAWAEYERLGGYHAGDYERLGRDYAGDYERLGGDYGPEGSSGGGLAKNMMLSGPVIRPSPRPWRRPWVP